MPYILLKKVENYSQIMLIVIIISSNSGIYTFREYWRISSKYSEFAEQFTDMVVFSKSKSQQPALVFRLQVDHQLADSLHSCVFFSHKIFKN